MLPNCEHMNYRASDCYAAQPLKQGRAERAKQPTRPPWVSAWEWWGGLRPPLLMRLGLNGEHQPVATHAREPYHTRSPAHARPVSCERARRSQPKTSTGKEACSPSGVVVACPAARAAPPVWLCPPRRTDGDAASSSGPGQADSNRAPVPCNATGDGRSTGEFLSAPAFCGLRCPRCRHCQTQTILRRTRFESKLRRVRTDPSSPSSRSRWPLPTPVCNPSRTARQICGACARDLPSD